MGTALVTISNELKGFDRTGWVVVAYLITYTGTVISHCLRNVHFNEIDGRLHYRLGEAQ